MASILPSGESVGARDRIEKARFSKLEFKGPKFLAGAGFDYANGIVKTAAAVDDGLTVGGEGKEKAPGLGGIARFPDGPRASEATASP